MGVHLVERFGSAGSSLGMTKTRKAETDHVAMTPGTARNGMDIHD